MCFITTLCKLRWKSCLLSFFFVVERNKKMIWNFNILNAFLRRMVKWCVCVKVAAWITSISNFDNTYICNTPWVHLIIWMCVETDQLKHHRFINNLGSFTQWHKMLFWLKTPYCLDCSLFWVFLRNIKADRQWEDSYSQTAEFCCACLTKINCSRIFSPSWKH